MRLRSESRWTERRPLPGTTGGSSIWWTANNTRAPTVPPVGIANVSLHAWSLPRVVGPDLETAQGRQHVFEHDRPDTPREQRTTATAHEHVRMLEPWQSSVAPPFGLLLE